MLDVGLPTSQWSGRILPTIEWRHRQFELCLYCGFNVSLGLHSCQQWRFVLATICGMSNSLIGIVDS